MFVLFFFLPFCLPPIPLSNSFILIILDFIILDYPSLLVLFRIIFCLVFSYVFGLDFALFCFLLVILSPCPAALHCQTPCSQSHLLFTNQSSCFSHSSLLPKVLNHSDSPETHWILAFFPIILFSMYLFYVLVFLQTSLKVQYVVVTTCGQT